MRLQRGGREPVFNVLFPRPGVVKVHDGDPEAVGPAAAVTSTDQTPYVDLSAAIGQQPQQRVRDDERRSSARLVRRAFAFGGAFAPDIGLSRALHARPGTTILFDDWSDRSLYHAVERHCPVAALHGRMAELVVRTAVEPAALVRDLLNHCTDPR